MIKERSRYHFVYQAILAQIEQGQLAPGDSLPTAQQLCRQYGVGITTIRRVLRMLETSQVISCVRAGLALGDRLFPGGDELHGSIELLAERGEALARSLRLHLLPVSRSRHGRRGPMARWRRLRSGADPKSRA